jgi:hypothetical protein
MFEIQATLATEHYRTETGQVRHFRNCSSSRNLFGDKNGQMSQDGQRMTFHIWKMPGPRSARILSKTAAAQDHDKTATAAQDRDAQFVRARAVGMHMTSQTSQFMLEFTANMPGIRARSLISYRKDPSVWAH